MQLDESVALTISQVVDARVVNIAVLVSLPILSAILFEYCHDYHQCWTSYFQK